MKMTSRFYEIPKRLVKLLRTAGPVHGNVSRGYCYSVLAVLGGGESAAGFIVEQRLAERSAPAAEGVGMAFAVPVRPEVGAEETFVFVESLADALDYIRQKPVAA